MPNTVVDEVTGTYVCFKDEAADKDAKREPDDLIVTLRCAGHIDREKHHRLPSNGKLRNPS